MILAKSLLRTIAKKTGKSIKKKIKRHKKMVNNLYKSQKN